MDLNPGEILCDGCEGVGKHSYKKSYGFTRYEIIECNICKGTGKLDWIETIVGKKEKYIDVLNNMFGLTMCDKKPENPIEGMCYFDHSLLVTYIFTNGHWVIISDTNI